MATVFVVTKGEYSDYGIEAMFSTREGAEQYIVTAEAQSDAVYDAEKETFRLSYGDNRTLEEWDLDVVETPLPGAYAARMTINGRWGSDASVRVSWEAGVSPSTPHRAERNRYYDIQIDVYGYGETREHARRSAAELHRAIRAGTVVGV